MKKNLIAILGLSLGLTLSNSGWLLAGELPLQPNKYSCDRKLAIDDLIWSGNPRERKALLGAIDHSLKYLDTPSATAAYRNYALPEITLDRVRRSLVRFRQLLVKARTPQELQASVEREFVFYQSREAVRFTGYFQPIYAASRTPTAEYRYPLYRKPPNLQNWSKPHPIRAALEGKDGLSGKNGPLAGLELVWLKDRLEAFLVQIQGSARLQLNDGKIMTVGYAGNTDYPYTSIGGELVKDGIFSLEELTLPLVLNYLRTHPRESNGYLSRNNRFIFFQETNGKPPTGSIGVPVTSNRSIATDKSLMPPGALALICAPIPVSPQKNPSQFPLVSRFVLDQDTGSAIKGAGRVDVFMGSGALANERAGLLNGEGKLYYLLLEK